MEENETLREALIREFKEETNFRGARTLNVGPRFFTSLKEIPIWWISFQYSTPSMLLMILTGSLFSVVCITVFLKLIKAVNHRNRETNLHQRTS